MSIEILLQNGDTIELSAVKSFYDDNDLSINLRDKNGKVWIEAKKEQNNLIAYRIESDIAEDLEILNEKLDSILLDLIETEQQGTEDSESSQEIEIQPFNPEDIKVHAKQFSLRLIFDMIKEDDIDLTPDFQRNVVWSNFNKSRLIESILLRIPLPMFYFAEEPDGRITIVDGLQRLTTIKEFMENKFPLKNLEYLEESCGGRYYSNEGQKRGLEKKYFRWFNQTQFSVNVIDPTSPPKVKYDIFRRINTGGKPLNNQEIRNCLAGKGLRSILRRMANLKEFKKATNNSIRSRRMDDQEVALRFILFHKIYDTEENIEAYNGYMESSLNDMTESLRNSSEAELEKYLFLFSKAMQNAEYLIGSKFAFRKIRPKDLEPGARKQLINKALFVSCSVLLSYYEPEVIIEENDRFCLLNPLAEEINTDFSLLNSLSYGTNAKSNLSYIFNSIENLISNNIIRG